ncbi:hypothetical protein LCGC14_2550390 [marine sediment metagenome]|uniref:Uncharacterized protein n=1 Tax=marine sediment metagenome TaxID=412755 RepID=A0A0F9ANL3_9ZZZZ
MNKQANKIRKLKIELKHKAQMYLDAHRPTLLETLLSDMDKLRKDIVDLKSYGKVCSKNKVLSKQIFNNGGF